MDVQQASQGKGVQGDRRENMGWQLITSAQLGSGEMLLKHFLAIPDLRTRDQKTSREGQWVPGFEGERAWHWGDAQAPRRPSRQEPARQSRQ